MKKFFIFLGSVVALFAVLFAVDVVGWRLLGFQMCTAPDRILVETVCVTDDGVQIGGAVWGSVPDYVGYTYSIDGDAMYIGIKHSIPFGSGGGDFLIEIDMDMSGMERIYLTDGKEDKCIWMRSASDAG